MYLPSSRRRLPIDSKSLLTAQWIFSTRTLKPPIVWSNGYTAKATNSIATDPGKNFQTRFWQLGRLSTLADAYDVGALKDDILDKLYYICKVQKKWAAPGPDLVHYVYDNTAQRISFRRILAACFCWNAKERWFTTKTALNVLVKYPEFAADLAIAFAQKNQGRADPLRGNRSDFKENIHKAMHWSSIAPRTRIRIVDSDSSDSDDSGEETRPSKRAKRARRQRMGTQIEVTIRRFWYVIYLQAILLFKLT